ETETLLALMKAKLGLHYEKLFRAFDDNDPALEWCENDLLAIALPDRRLNRSVASTDYELFANFTQSELSAVEPLLQRRAYQKGEVIIHSGAEAMQLFFLAAGNVSVMVPLPSGTRKRLATLSAGMAFGEMAIIDRAPRSATIVADSDAECDLFTIEDFEALGQTHPAIKIKLLQNLSLGLCHKLRKANRELSVFD
ncbi:MAG: cyclic nucleotide-binding domain-containing protein, partial [Verrucomicrobiota bacterium]